MQHRSRPLCAALIRPDGASSVFVFQRSGGEHYTCSCSGSSLVQIIFTSASRVTPPKKKKITAEFKRNLCGLDLDARTVRQHSTCFLMAFFSNRADVASTIRRGVFQNLPVVMAAVLSTRSAGGETQRCLLNSSISRGRSKRETRFFL